MASSSGRPWAKSRWMIGISIEVIAGRPSRRAIEEPDERRLVALHRHGLRASVGMSGSRNRSTRLEQLLVVRALVLRPPDGQLLVLGGRVVLEEDVAGAGQDVGACLVEFEDSLALEGEHRVVQLAVEVSLEQREVAESVHVLLGRRCPARPNSAKTLSTMSWNPMSSVLSGGQREVGVDLRRTAVGRRAAELGTPRGAADLLDVRVKPVAPLLLLLQALRVLGVDVFQRPAVARVGVEGEPLPGSLLRRTVSTFMSSRTSVHLASSLPYRSSETSSRDSLSR